MMESGTLEFSKRGKRLIGQEMFKILERAKDMERRGQRVFHLELGNSSFPPPSEVTQATIDALMNGKVGYVPSSGHPELRMALAKYYGDQGCTGITENNFVISPANLLINQVLDLIANGGDSVVVFTPAFPTYLAAINHIGLVPNPIALEKGNGFHLTRQVVDQAISLKPKVIIVNSANNPTGAVYTQTSLEYLIHQCAQHGIWVLSDETYAELCYRWPFWSLSASEYERLIVVSSFSKAYSIPGYRTGYAIANPLVAAKLTLSCSTLFSCLPMFTQEGCVAALQVGEAYLHDVRTHYSRMTEKCADLINQSNVLSCAVPDAAFYLFIHIQDTHLNAQEFCERLLQERETALTPGNSFGPGLGSFVRASVSGPEEDVLEGIRRLVHFGLEARETPSWWSEHTTPFKRVGHAV
ncbi:MAG: pyridoxal phosphate-dependent aminotransferase [Nitrospirales bacterium]